jgi:hypothetical protein
MALACRIFDIFQEEIYWIRVILMSNIRHIRGGQYRDKLAKIRRMVALKRYDWSSKVEDELNQGNYETADLEVCIASGGIMKCEKDELGLASDGKKYTIVGVDRSGYAFYTAGKIKRDEDGEFYFFITAHDFHRGGSDV